MFWSRSCCPDNSHGCREWRPVHWHSIRAIRTTGSARPTGRGKISNSAAVAAFVTSHRNSPASLFPQVSARRSAGACSMAFLSESRGQKPQAFPLSTFCAMTGKKPVVPNKTWFVQPGYRKTQHRQVSVSPVFLVPSIVEHRENAWRERKS